VIQSAPFDNAGGERVVFAVGRHLQAQILAGGRITVQYLAQHRPPLLEELFVAEVGVDTVQ